MQDRDLQKLKRADLLEMLVELSKENDALKRELEEAQRKLEDRNIILREAGNIAEASLRLNGVFDAAQKAAEQYLENVRRLSSGQQPLPQPEAPVSYLKPARHTAARHTSLVHEPEPDPILVIKPAGEPAKPVTRTAPADPADEPVPQLRPAMAAEPAVGSARPAEEPVRTPVRRARTVKPALKPAVKPAAPAVRTAMAAEQKPVKPATRQQAIRKPEANPAVTPVRRANKHGKRQ
ncbi:MAG: hypothetical protein IKD69_07575 [Solobacterium sp.]|nr:hypothetical protein [Solobacterium sp.]